MRNIVVAVVTHEQNRLENNGSCLQSVSGNYPGHVDAQPGPGEFAKNDTFAAANLSNLARNLTPAGSTYAQVAAKTSILTRACHYCQN